MSSLRPTRSAVCIAMLVMTLLFAQALGYVHGIVHAGWLQGTVHSMIDESLFDAGESHVADDGEAGDAPGHQHAYGAHHSCAAYDAATLSAGMQHAFPPPPLLPPTRVMALWQAFASWDAPFICHFSSRAPPR